MSKIVIVNQQSGEIIEREMTVEELAKKEEEKNKNLAKAAARLEVANAKKALLEKLGITEEEARLLLGGN